MLTWITLLQFWQTLKFVEFLVELLMVVLTWWNAPHQLFRKFRNLVEQSTGLKFHSSTFGLTIATQIFALVSFCTYLWIVRIHYLVSFNMTLLGSSWVQIQINCGTHVQCRAIRFRIAFRYIKSKLSISIIGFNFEWRLNLSFQFGHDFHSILMMLIKSLIPCTGASIKDVPEKFGFF